MITEKTFPDFFGNDLDFLGSFKTITETDNGDIINYYEELNLKTVRNKENYEFWIDNLLVHSLPTKANNECRVLEVFKKNFLLISKGSCGIATPDFVDRNDVKVIDLNSNNIYRFSLEELKLTRSIEMANVGYPNSKIYSAIVSFDLESQIIKIYNQSLGILEVNMTENN
ncbi:hypothetical protein [Croceitalea vernalis]|uniref:Uncharacterized protein n=1 Tax=Croceitalea vernalis TaxID=3075599 RepID=A0ABU3BIP7_9FLAO|nr:hypothetical protein [Croceitalea sp. P007]MDT0622039.1 hypothetical protein [Croceitalea sp. P007]